MMDELPVVPALIVALFLWLLYLGARWIDRLEKLPHPDDYSADLTESRLDRMDRRS